MVINGCSTTSNGPGVKGVIVRRKELALTNQSMKERKRKCETHTIRTLPNGDLVCNKCGEMLHELENNKIMFESVPSQGGCGLNHCDHPGCITLSEDTQPTGEWEVELAEKGTPLAIFQKERTDAISEMFDNKYADGIYPTGKFFARIDECVRQLLTTEREKVIKEEVLTFMKEIQKRADVVPPNLLLNEVVNYAYDRIAHLKSNLK